MFLTTGVKRIHWLSKCVPFIMTWFSRPLGWERVISVVSVYFYMSYTVSTDSFIFCFSRKTESSSLLFALFSHHCHAKTKICSRFIMFCILFMWNRWYLYLVDYWLYLAKMLVRLYMNWNDKLYHTANSTLTLPQILFFTQQTHWFWVTPLRQCFERSSFVQAWSRRISSVCTSVFT